MKKGGRNTARSVLAAAVILAAPVLQNAAGQDAGAGGETAQGQEGALVNFNFEQVDVRHLVKLVGDLTGRRFVVDQAVEGKVTVVTPSRIPVSEVYPLFLSVLESCECAVVEAPGGVFRVVSHPRQGRPLTPVADGDAGKPPEGLLTKVLRLEHIQAAELLQTLAPSQAGAAPASSMAVLESSNCLIVTDTPSAIARIEQIIRQLDKPGAARSIELVPLQYADARSMADELTQAMAGLAQEMFANAERIRQRLASSPAPTQAGPTITAAPHANNLIVSGSASQIAEIKRLVERLDVPPHSGRGRLRAVFLQYLTSEDAAKSLSALLAKRADAGRAASIAIEASLANNALIVDAEPQDFEMVKNLLAELDSPPQQVLVEVVIAEVMMEDGENIGFEIMGGGAPESDRTIAMGGMRTAEGEDTLMQNVLAGSVPQGLTFGLMRGTYTDSSGRTVPGMPVLFNLNAIKTKGNWKILSNVPLWAQNNKEASVSVVKNIPILKSTVTGGAGTARDVIENIDRVDVGIKLTVTPQVNPNQEVLMKLNPSIEAIVETSTGGKAFTPTIAKREVATTVTVPDGRTIVISGLIREDNIERIRRVPVLGSIPLLGMLFRHKAKSVERTNLLVFVTPHIVKDMQHASLLRESLESRTGLSADPSRPDGDRGADQPRAGDADNRRAEDGAGN